MANELHAIRFGNSTFDIKPLCTTFFTDSTHSDNASKANFNGDEKPSKYPFGLSVNTVYGGVSTGWPYDYGNALTIRGMGTTQLMLSWNASQTTDNPNVSQSVYIRSQRDSAGDNWSKWTRLMTDDVTYNSTTSRSANTVLAGPKSGNSAAASFRKLVAADIPSIASSKVSALTGYTSVSAATDLATTDTLNSALAKLEYKAKTAYNWYKDVSKTDSDELINKWDEIVGFLDSVAEGTDITDEFVTRKTDQEITGKKSFTNAIKILDGKDLILHGRTNDTNDPGDIAFSNNAGTELARLFVSYTDDAKKLNLRWDADNNTIAEILHTKNISKSTVGLGNVENTKLSTWAGSSNLTTCKQGKFGAAATYGVTTSITNGSNALITSGAVYTGLAGKANVTHSHSKSEITDFAHSHDYLPLTGGTLTGEVQFDIAGLAKSDICTGVIAAFKAPRIQSTDLICNTITLGASTGSASNLPLTIRKYSKVTNKNPDGITDLVTFGLDGNVTATSFTGSLSGNASSATTATYASYLGTSSSNYTKASLDAVLSGKSDTGHAHDYIPNSPNSIEMTGWSDQKTPFIDFHHYDTVTNDYDYRIICQSGGSGVGKGRCDFEGITNFKGNVLTHKDNTYDLGTSSKKWKTVYAHTFSGTATYATSAGSAKASDVYAWAKAATKPSYKTSEVAEETNLYFTNQRAIDACSGTYMLAGDTSHGIHGDTKNTTGTTNKASTKLFLAGATSQADNPQTYSNSNCYIGTDNALYSAGERTITGIYIHGDGESSVLADNHGDINLIPGTNITISNYSDEFIENAIRFDCTATDTKNTTGTTEKALTKLYLAGATSQADNPQTYSNSRCYIGTDNALYSAGERTITGLFINELGERVTADASGDITLISGTNVTFSLQSKNTIRVDCYDTKVKQLSLETNGKYPILMAYSASPTSGLANYTYYNTGVYINPYYKYVYATGFFETSDANLKNFISDIDVDLDKIKQLPKKYFTWKDGDQKQHIGTSAQEVQKIYPELVSDSDGTLTVDYAKLSVVALAAVDKLVDKQKELEDRLAKLETIVSKLTE